MKRTLTQIFPVASTGVPHTNRCQGIGPAAAKYLPETRAIGNACRFPKAKALTKHLEIHRACSEPQEKKPGEAGPPQTGHRRYKRSKDKERDDQRVPTAKPTDGEQKLNSQVEATQPHPKASRTLMGFERRRFTAWLSCTWVRIGQELAKRITDTIKLAVDLAFELLLA